MEEWIKQVKDSWNVTSDSEWYQSRRSDEKIAELIKAPKEAFHPAVYELINKYLPDLKGKKILLPSSGDNHAAFAFAILGAEVTSTDISERQLENSAFIAEKLKLNIKFICDDTMHLDNIEDNKYDLVYTSNGTHTWIPDLIVMYKNIYRVLKPSGYSIMYDIHPFNRTFTGEPWKEPQVAKSYHDIMPSCHWRVQDLVNANTSAQLSIREMAELQAVDASFWYTYDEIVKQKPDSYQNINDWRSNPMAALPAWITIVSQK